MPCFGLSGIIFAFALAKQEFPLGVYILEYGMKRRTSYFVAALLGFCSLASASFVATVDEARNLEFTHVNAYAWQINNVVFGAEEEITGAWLTLEGINNFANPGDNDNLYITMVDDIDFLFAKPYNKKLDATQSSNINERTNITRLRYKDYGNSTLYKMDETNENANSDYFAGVGTQVGVYQDEYDSDTKGPATWETIRYSLNLDMLKAFITNNADFAFAMDPDCHYEIQGLKVEIETKTTTTDVPEAATVQLLGMGMVVLMGAAWQRRKKQ
jgi:hypothetical protein